MPQAMLLGWSGSMLVVRSVSSDKRVEVVLFTLLVC
jgi:hypothetical protein